MSNAPFVLTEAATSLLDMALTQDKALTLRAKPIAVAISTATDRNAEADAFFVVFYAARVLAKDSGDTARMRATGKAWNRAKAAVEYHLKDAGFAVSWRNVASGEGTTIVNTLKEAKAEAEQNRAAQAEREAEARQAAATAKAAALRELSAADLAAQISQLVAAWSGDASEVWAALNLTDKAELESAKAELESAKAELEILTAAPPARSTRRTATKPTMHFATN